MPAPRGEAGALRVEVHRRGHAGDQGDRDRVNDHRRRLVAALGDQPGGEGDQRDQPQVERFSVVSRGDAIELATEDVVIAPHGRDDHERQAVGAEGVEQVAKLVPEVAVGACMGMLSTSSVSAIANAPSLSATVRS